MFPSRQDRVFSRPHRSQCKTTDVFGDINHSRFPNSHCTSFFAILKCADSSLNVKSKTLAASEGNTSLDHWLLPNTLFLIIILEFVSEKVILWKAPGARLSRLLEIFSSAKSPDNQPASIPALASISSILKNVFDDSRFIAAVSTLPIMSIPSQMKLTIFAVVTLKDGKLSKTIFLHINVVFF